MQKLSNKFKTLGLSAEPRTKIKQQIAEKWVQIWFEDSSF